MTTAGTNVTGQVLLYDNYGGEDYTGYKQTNNIFSSTGNYYSQCYGGCPNSSQAYFNGNYFHDTSSSVYLTWGSKDWNWKGGEFTTWQNTYSPIVSNNTLDLSSSRSGLITNVATRDYSLVAGSPIIDKGVNLTTVTSATGSGTSFTVADSHFFCDGWNLIPGDTIMVGNQQTTITSINYNTHTITVNSAVSWTQNVTGVNLPFSGTAPDPGAYEFGSQLVVPPNNLRIVQ